MDDAPRKIEIFAPFSAALDLTKLILFQPFDIAKWLVIGFAAFLANLAGNGGNFNFNKRFPSSGNWNFHSTSHDVGSASAGWPGWVWPLILVCALLIIGIVVACLWVGARGKFVFADCVVRNRAAIVEPWKEFRREGNSYFRFLLLAALILIVLLAFAGAPLWIPFAMHGDWPDGFGLVVGISVLVLVAVGASAVVNLLSRLLVPVMYRQRCDATTAVREAIALICRHFAPVALYFLFSIVLVLAFVAISCILTCLTCCITAIPYVGTVVLLPGYVFFMAYLLLFVRQFGSEYDVWANARPGDSASLLTEPSGSEPPPFQPS